MMTKWNGIWSARGEKVREIRPEVETWDIDDLLNRRDEVIIIIIIIILESAVQGRERVKTLYQSKDPKAT